MGVKIADLKGCILGAAAAPPGTVGLIDPDIVLVVSLSNFTFLRFCRRIYLNLLSSDYFYGTSCLVNVGCCKVIGFIVRANELCDILLLALIGLPVGDTEHFVKDCLDVVIHKVSVFSGDFFPGLVDCQIGCLIVLQGQSIAVLIDQAGCGPMGRAVIAVPVVNPVLRDIVLKIRLVCDSIQYKRTFRRQLVDINTVRICISGRYLIFPIILRLTAFLYHMEKVGLHDDFVFGEKNGRTVLRIIGPRERCTIFLKVFRPLHQPDLQSVLVHGIGSFRIDNLQLFLIQRVSVCLLPFFNDMDRLLHILIG